MIDEIERRGINTIRGLALDGPNAARSGHQGTALALAPLAHVLFTRILRYDAADAAWPDRDRFVLSIGHASMLQYSMLHLTGYGLTLEDLKEFRQWDSATPGHPEYGHTAGVETTTGPLGQGFANAVGMALAERWMRSRFGSDICDHHTYVICGDGDLSEGLSHEAASLAGNQKLGHLVAIYDDNHITIDGPTEIALTDDAVARFESYGWHVEAIGETGENIDELEEAIERAKAVTDKPSLIVLRSHIGYPSPSLTDHPSAHGLAFGDAEISEVKAELGSPDEPFWTPDDVVAYYREAGRRGSTEREKWSERTADMLPDLRAEYDAVISGEAASDWADELPHYESDSPIATRKASQECLRAAGAGFVGLISGAADLTGNTGTDLGDKPMNADSPDGRQLYYGIREHAMGAIMNGMAQHNLRPVGGTFLVFSDYMRGAVRLAALMGLPVVYSWTHDSVGVGEDGPTHQPVEQIAALRAMPGLMVVRPADGNETAAAWQLAMGFDGPTAMILTRQGLPVLDGTSADGVAKGGYVLQGADAPDVVLVATGSEVQHCVDAAEMLGADGLAVQVVSLPCWSRFDEQSDDYRNSVLPPGAPTVSCEAGVSFGWSAYADAHVSIDRFGASAPADTVMDELGISAANVVATAKRLIDRTGSYS